MRNIYFIVLIIFLANQMFKLKKIKHSTVTDDYIAAEEIQNQNWQYYVEQVIEFCYNKEIGKTIRTPQSNLFLILSLILPKLNNHIQLNLGKWNPR